MNRLNELLAWFDGADKTALRRRLNAALLGVLVLDGVLVLLVLLRPAAVAPALGPATPSSYQSPTLPGISPALLSSGRTPAQSSPPQPPVVVPQPPPTPATIAPSLGLDEVEIVPTAPAEPLRFNRVEARPAAIRPSLPLSAWPPDDTRPPGEN